MRPIFRSKPAVVHDLLREQIIRGDYLPGARLVIDEVAAQLGVSQIPVREAIRQLEADGFVDFEPYTGATVTEFSPDLIFEIFALLESLEVICGRRACTCMGEAEVQELTRAVEAMDATVAAPEVWSTQNKQFHLTICQFANVTLIDGMLEKALDHWDRLRTFYIKDVLQVRITEAQQEHHALVAAFRNRDPHCVEQLLRTHNQRALAAYIEVLRAHGYLEHQEGEC